MQANAPLVTWKNDAGLQDAQRFIIRLPVAGVHRRAFYTTGPSLPTIFKGRAFEEPFLFDTGAAYTLVSGNLARRLRLPLGSQPKRLGLAGTMSRVFVETKICVMIGAECLLLPCVVPYPLRSGWQSENVLGMGGTLERFEFHLNRHELAVYDAQEI